MVALVVLAICTVGFLVADGPRAALSPALSTVVCAAVLYMLVKHPPPSRRWSKQRIIVGAAVLGPATLAVLVWAAVVVPDWPTRLLALVVIALVPAIVFWAVRTARKEDQAARASMQGTPAD